jgi:hypothetical protein
MRRRDCIKVLGGAVAGASAGQSAADIVLENAELRFILAADGRARSLIHKATGEECLARSDVPAFLIRQHQPLPGQ